MLVSPEQLQQLAKAQAADANSSDNDEAATQAGSGSSAASEASSTSRKQSKDSRASSSRRESSSTPAARPMLKQAGEGLGGSAKFFFGQGIVEVDLAWNNIRGAGATALLEKLGASDSLKVRCGTIVEACLLAAGALTSECCCVAGA